MATYKTNSLGYPLVLNGPDTVEDYDRAAGKVGACLEDAVDNTIYRGTLPEWQSAFQEYLETTFGEKLRVNESATAAAKARSKTPDKVKDVMETVKVYHNRIKAGLDEDAQKALSVKAQEIANGIVIDPSPSKRAAGITKDYLSKANVWLTLPVDQMEAKVTKALESIAPAEYVLERDEENLPKVESLARLIGLYIDTLL